MMMSLDGLLCKYDFRIRSMRVVSAHLGVGVEKLAIAASLSPPDEPVDLLIYSGIVIEGVE